MGNLATVEQLAAFMGTDLEDDDPRALRALRDATSFIRLRTSQRIELVEDDVVELAGNWTDVLWLPQIPVKVGDEDDPYDVAPVVALRCAGESVFTDLASTAFSAARNGQLKRFGGDWGGYSGRVAVTYTHGYDPAIEAQAEVLEQVASLCVGLAARSMTQRAGVSAETFGAYAVSYGDEVASTGLTQLEADLLGGLRNPWQ